VERQKKDQSPDSKVAEAKSSRNHSNDTRKILVVLAIPWAPAAAQSWLCFMTASVKTKHLNCGIGKATDSHAQHRARETLTPIMFSLSHSKTMLSTPWCDSHTSGHVMDHIQSVGRATQHVRHCAAPLMLKTCFIRQSLLWVSHQYVIHGGSA
jgi:hypothetical protein